MRQRLAGIATLGITVIASGCSGGGSATAPAVPIAAKSSGSHATTTKATLTIRVPVRKAAATKSSVRKPQYVSTSTLDLAIRDGAATGSVQNILDATWQLIDLSSTNSICTPVVGNFRTCTVVVSAPVIANVQDAFEIDATDQAPVPGDINPLGNLLSSGYELLTVSAGAVNPIVIELNGVIGQLSIPAATTYSTWAAPGQSGALTVNITANDADGGPITGNGAAFDNPLTFTDNFQTSPTSPTSPYSYPPFLVPPATPGPVVASIGYLAPVTGISAPATTVTIATTPFFWLLQSPPPAVTFVVDPLVVSVGGLPVASVPNLAVGASDVTVSVNESAATAFTVTTNSGAPGVDGAVTLGALGPIVNGAATFTVHAVTATVNPANAPTISVTDANGTVATLTAVVGAGGGTPPAAMSIIRK